MFEDRIEVDAIFPMEAMGNQKCSPIISKRESGDLDPNFRRDGTEGRMELRENPP
jgi:hypothetical protein